MKQTVSEATFIDEFRAYNREDNFSPAALRALFEYLEDYEDATGEDVELDVIALCCDFAEYDAEELVQDYGHLLERDEDQDDEDYVAALVSDMYGETVVLETDAHTYVVQGF